MCQLKSLSFVGNTNKPNCGDVRYCS